MGKILVTVLAEIVEAALKGDKEKIEYCVNIIADKLANDGDKVGARIIREKLNSKTQISKAEVSTDKKNLDKWLPNEAVEVYKYTTKIKGARLPLHFWTDCSLADMEAIFKYVLIDKLQLRHTKLVEQGVDKILSENNLKTAYRELRKKGTSPYRVISKMYSEHPEWQ